MRHGREDKVSQCCIPKQGLKNFRRKVIRVFSLKSAVSERVEELITIELDCALVHVKFHAGK